MKMPLPSNEFIGVLYPFSKLNKPQRDYLCSLCEEKEYSPGKVIYLEGDPPDNLYLLLKGRLLVFTEQDGKEVEIELIKRGTFFGIISLFTDEPHSVTVRSIEPSVVIQINKESFKRFLSKNPFLAIDFSRLLSKKVKKRAGKPKRIFQSLRVGVCAWGENIDVTPYAVDLAQALFEETSKRIIVVECSFSEKFFLPSRIGIPMETLSITEYSESSFPAYIQKKTFSSLCVKLDGLAMDSFFSLMNLVCEDYHFILYTFPFAENLLHKHFFACADTIQILSTYKREEWARGQHLIKKVEPKKSPQIRRIVYAAKEPDEHDSKYPVYAVLSSTEDLDYKRVIRRISREIGEKTVGVALGSGAAFGLSHIGVLKVLEAHQIPVDIICGSSIGAFIAALWGMECSISEIEKLALDFGRKLLFTSFASFVFPFKGFLKSRKLEKIIKEVCGKKTFQDLRRKVRVSAFDFVKSEPRIIQEGFLYKAIAASCAMPGVFEPITLKEDIFLDGGVLTPLPVSAILDYAKKIIAVNVTPSREEIVREYTMRHKRRFTIFDFIFGSIETMQREFIEESKKSADVVIHPDMSGLSWVEFTKVKEFVSRGEQATLEKIDGIKKLISE